MFGNTYTLFTFMGFQVRANVSWLFLAILVTWSLAGSLFPDLYPDVAPRTHWLMGVVGMIGLFFSILFHEFAHSLEARRRGLPINGITLFIFGGASEMIEEPPSPGAEFWIAIVGPLSSVVLAGALWAVAQGLRAAGAPDHWVGVPGYLAVINVILAIFNLLPGFPLDGGRVFRAALWRWLGDLRRATLIASWGGRILGYALIVLGILSFAEGGAISGMWWVLIGLFLAASATTAYTQLLIHLAVKGRTVQALMTPDPVVVPVHMTVRDFAEEVLYHHDFDSFPVVDGDRLVGCVGKEDVRPLPRAEWSETAVAAILRACTADATIDRNEDAAKALDRMQASGNSRLMVMAGDRLVGVLVLKDLLHHLSLRRDLGDVHTLKG